MYIYIHMSMYIKKIKVQITHAIRRLARVFCGVLVIYFVIALASPIDCFCEDFYFPALLRLGIAFQFRLGRPSVESRFYGTSSLSFCYNFHFFFSFFRNSSQSYCLILFYSEFELQSQLQKHLALIQAIDFSLALAPAMA